VKPVKISVIGTGYVGLVSAVCLANLQHDVICADISIDKIATLASGGLPLFEIGLAKMLKTAQDQARIAFTTNIAAAIMASDLLIVTVGTPSSANGEANLAALWTVVEQIAEHTSQNQMKQKLLIIKSTVPVGTCDQIAEFLMNKNAAISDVVHNPEFLRQGSAVHDFYHPDRIVIGFENEQSLLHIQPLFKGFKAPQMNCSRKSAELIKYAANAFLAMKISYINMLADLSENLGTNIDDIAKGIGSDPRIGNAFLQAGVGFGGSCFPKDIRSLKAVGESVGISLPLIEATETINNMRAERIVTKLRKELGTLKGKRIALLGLAFKPMTDDVREAASLELSRLCIAEGATIHAFDPIVHQFPVDNVAMQPNPYSAIEGSDAVLLLTEWKVIRELNWTRVVGMLSYPLIIDCRNMLDWHEMNTLSQIYGLVYLSIGRPPIQSLSMFETPRESMSNIINK